MRVRYYVMLYHQNGIPVPMLAEDEYTMRLFDSEDEARAAAGDTRFGANFGWEISTWVVVP